ncbi:MAG: hypothetical protein HRU19_22965 [Pseudobacteriovorax sp.]|nr:hypothetical protein [Pseudobacteriovorax sp.]
MMPLQTSIGTIQGSSIKDSNLELIGRSLNQLPTYLADCDSWDDGIGSFIECVRDPGESIA